jgi:hypothetical protein
VLHSTEHALGLAEARSYAAQLPGGPGATLVIDSSDHPSLVPGYYAVVGYGYPSEEAARAGCATFGIPVGGGCYPRRVP